MKLIQLATCGILLIQTLAGLSLASSAVVSSNGITSQQQQQGSDQELQQSGKSSSVSALGGLYRSARESRCYRCYPTADDRYGSQRTPYPNRYDYGTTGGGGSGGSGASVGGYHDRNWYHYPDDRNRYDDRYLERYDDRYNARNYDRYEPPRQQNYYNDRYYDAKPDYRGNGYDNRGRYYDQPRYNEGGTRGKCYNLIQCIAPSTTDRFYERPRYGYESRYQERDPYYTNRYDYKNYRPYDETYRGQSGFDNSGRGYYFAGRPEDEDTPLLYRPPQSGPLPGQPPLYGDGRPYPQHPQSPPNPIQPQSPPNQPSQTVSSSSLGTAGSPSNSGTQHYGNDRPPPQQSSGDDSKGGYAGTWGYGNDRDRNRPSGSYGDRDKDIQSAGYGSRPRPLGGSYLHDRDTNTPIEIQNENKKDQGSVKPIMMEANNSGGGNGNSNLSPSSMDEDKNH